MAFTTQALYLDIYIYGYTPTCLLTHTQGSCYWDNACSFNISNNMSLFTDLTLLHHPMRVGGINGGCLITHSGYLSCLPSCGGINKGFYSMDATTTLFSLGHLHRCGGSYKTSSTLGIDIYAIGDCLLDHPSNLSNNLLPVDMRQLKVSKVRYTHHFAILPGQALAAVHYNAVEFLGRAFFREVLARNFNLNYLLKQPTFLDLE